MIPSAGYDSIPPDLSVFLANKTLKRVAAETNTPSDIATSVTAHRVRGPISSGTIGTVFTVFSGKLLERSIFCICATADWSAEIPRALVTASGKPYALSPGKILDSLQLFNEFLIVPQFRADHHLDHGLCIALEGLVLLARYGVQSGLWLPSTELLCRERGDCSSPKVSFALEAPLAPRVLKPARAAARDDSPSALTYGKDFVYDEFLQTPGPISALICSLGIASVFVGISTFSSVSCLIWT